MDDHQRTGRNQPRKISLSGSIQVHEWPRQLRVLQLPTSILLRSTVTWRDWHSQTHTVRVYASAGSGVAPRRARQSLSWNPRADASPAHLLLLWSSPDSPGCNYLTCFAISASVLYLVQDLSLPSSFHRAQMHSVVSRCWLHVCWSEENGPSRQDGGGRWGGGSQNRLGTLFTCLVANLSFYRTGILYPHSEERVLYSPTWLALFALWLQEFHEQDQYVF